MMRVIDNHRAELSPIPVDWVHTRMKAAVRKYQNKKNEDESTTVLSLTKSGLKIKTDLSFGKSTESYIGHQIVNKGQFVFTPRDFDATPILCGVSDYNGCISNLYIVFDVAESVYPKYLEYYLYGLKYGFNYFQKLSFGMRYSFNHKQFEHIPLIYPNYEVQKEIADFLDRETDHIEQLIEKKQRLIVVLQEKQASLINNIVRNGMLPNTIMKKINFSGINLIPECWDVKKLRHLGGLQNGISESAEYFGEGYPFVSYGDVYNHFTLPENVSGLAKSSDNDRRRYSVLAGDVFFTRTSEVAEEIGISSVCLETVDNATFSGFLIRFRPNAKTLLPNFSKYYFRSDIPRLFFVKEMNLVTRVSLSQGLLKSLPVIIPPIEEQEKISHYLDMKTAKINLLIKNIEHSINRLKEFRSSLITEAVTGQLDIELWKKRGSTDERLDNIEESMRT
ncbi:TPA: restriction endonuclease subunit S [Legionella pneumophila]|nr:restriction endonuclease subunit S [Legionella pneumophila]HAW6263349.1 restriction endonuclease subunit S [Legionella pneumophila]